MQAALARVSPIPLPPPQTPGGVLESTGILTSSPDIPDKGTEDNWAVVFACLPSDSTHPTVVPGCQLNATWPRGFGDVIWGEDNCLYDAGGKDKINNQCAQPIDPSQIGDVNNPYYNPPQSPSQPPPTTTNPFPACTGVDLSKLTCAANCCGFIDCPDWCNVNCGGAVC